MAKGKYHQWLSEDALSQLTNWAAHGLMDKEIAQNMGVHISTFCEWENRFPEFAEAIKKGRSMRDIEVENALFALAVGKCEEVTEVVETREELINGRLVVTMRQRRVTRRRLAPNTGAAAFMAKNHLGYSDNPTVNTADASNRPVYYFDPSETV